MATVRPFDEQAWAEWVATRPPVVQSLCKRLPPDRLYRLATTGQRVVLHAYNEDGTVTVLVSGLYNRVMLERCVFGISPDDLTECDPPQDPEPIGAVLTEDDEIEEFIVAERKRRGL